MMQPHIHIQFPDPNSSHGTLELVGTGKRFPCRGNAGWNYPFECTILPARHKKNYSRNTRNNNNHNLHNYRCHITHTEQEKKQMQHVIKDLPYAVSIDEARGSFLHEGETTPEGQLAHPQAQCKGCIELAKGDAKEVYDWIQNRTKLSISHKWLHNLDS